MMNGSVAIQLGAPNARLARLRDSRSRTQPGSPSLCNPERRLVSKWRAARRSIPVEGTALRVAAIVAPVALGFAEEQEHRSTSADRGRFHPKLLGGLLAGSGVAARHVSLDKP